MKRFILTFIILLQLLPAKAFWHGVGSGSSCSTFNPSNPAACGYSVVFSDNFTTLSTICTGTTAACGSAKNWYINDFVDGGSTNTSAFALANSGAGPGLVLTADRGTNFQLETATVFGSPNDAFGVVCNKTSCASSTGSPGGTFSGTTFTGGWYAETSITWVLANQTSTNGWPAFWSLPIEKAGNGPFGGTCAPGQTCTFPNTGQVEYIENDIMEYEANSSSNWLGTTHDWYGTTSNPYGAPGGDLTNYCLGGKPYNECNFEGTATDGTHIYGQLWVPGVGTINYIDGVEVTSSPWATANCSTSQVPPASGSYSAPWTPGYLFSHFDCTHNFIILGGAVGVPLTINYVHVWQHS